MPRFSNNNGNFVVSDSQDFPALPPPAASCSPTLSEEIDQDIPNDQLTNAQLDKIIDSPWNGGRVFQETN